MSTRNMASELPLVLDVLSDDLEIVFFFLEKAKISSFKLLQHPHFVRETLAISIHIFSHDVAQAEAHWNVKEKHKYRPQNVIRFHLQGCICVLKRPPTLPTSKDTHSNDKRFGNLPPSFRSLAFFLRSITVKSLALYEWTNGTEIFGNSGKSGKQEIPRKVLPFFPKTFHRDEPFHLNSPRNYRKFHSNGKCSWSHQKIRIFSLADKK